MTTRLSLFLFVLIVAAIALDTLVLKTGATLSTLQRGADLLRTLAFWR